MMFLGYYHYVSVTLELLYISMMMTSRLPILPFFVRHHLICLSAASVVIRLASNVSVLPVFKAAFGTLVMISELVTQGLFLPHDLHIGCQDPLLLLQRLYPGLKTRKRRIHPLYLADKLLVLFSFVVILLGQVAHLGHH